MILLCFNLTTKTSFLTRGCGRVYNRKRVYYMDRCWEPGISCREQNYSGPRTIVYQAALSMGYSYYYLKGVITIEGAHPQHREYRTMMYYQYLRPKGLLTVVLVTRPSVLIIVSTIVINDSLTGVNSLAHTTASVRICLTN